MASPLPQRWLVAHRGRIYTQDSQQPRAEALLACDGRIVAVGSDAEIHALSETARRLGSVETLDLGGRCVLPGFTDSHIHFLSMSLSLDRVALAGVASFDEVLRRVGAAASSAAAGEWVQGWGWDHSLWDVPQFPDKQSLDRVTAQVPTVLRRKDGHMIWVNSAALEAAGVSRQTPDPSGGRIGRGADGQPNGLFFEEAQDLIYRAVPDVNDEQALRAVRRGMALLHSYGVTGVHIPEGATTLRALQALDARGDLHLRATMMLTLDGLDDAIRTGLRTGFGGDRLRIGPAKIFSDGSLGSETAAMLDPFENSADNRGILTLPESEIRDAIRRASEAGIACAVHAIGDRANRIVLDAFEAYRGVWELGGLRPRTEHVQVLHEQDVPRLGQIGVIASMQPIHTTQDMDLVDKLWGARGRYAYAFRSLLESGARLAFGSDAPVETADPLAGLYAAVARRRPDGCPADGWFPQERISIQDAVAAYTTGAAYAASLEHVAGTLCPGAYSDFVVLSQDIMTGPPERILETKVDLTVFDGRAVFQR